MTLYTVPGTGFAQLLVNAGDGSTMVINRDETNQLIMGDDNSVASKAGTGDIDIIDPLSYIVYSGLTSKYGICAVPGASIQVNCVQGATQWAPSPAQAAFQISLLGLATSSNQATQQTTLDAINGATVSLNSHYPNPDFTAPNGNADITGWLLSGGTIATAGLNGSVALPPGSGEANGCILTPPGTNNFLGTFPSAGIPCQPGQTPYGHFKMTATGLTGVPGAYFGQAAFQFYTSTGTFISASNVNILTTANATWQKYYATCPVVAPATTAYVVMTPALVIGAGNIPNTVGAYMTAINAGILGQPGTHGGDHAAHSAIAGVPLNRLHNTLFSAASTALTAGTPVNIPASPAPFNQIGYSLFLGAYVTSGAVNGFLEISIIWYDKASGQAVDQQFHWIYAGSNLANIHNVRITGPTEGNEVQITVTAFGAPITVANLYMFQSSAIYSRHFPLTTFMGALPAGTTVAFNDPLAFILGKRSAAAVAAGSTDTSVIPYYQGRVYLYANTAAAAAGDLLVTVNPFADQGSAGNLNIFQNQCDGQGNVQSYIELPRAQCLIAMKNTGAAPQTLSYAVIAAPEG